MYYSYVHESDGKYWGRPVELTEEEANELRSGKYSKFMKMRGYELKAVNKLTKTQECQDKYYHLKEDYGRFTPCTEEYNPELKYVSKIYSFSSQSHKIPYRRAG